MLYDYDNRTVFRFFDDVLTNSLHIDLFNTFKPGYNLINNFLTFPFRLSRRAGFIVP